MTSPAAMRNSNAKEWPPARLPALRGSRSLRAALLLAVMSLLVTAPSGAQLPSSPTDSQVEAAYLYKFGPFVTWPNPPPSNAFAICILGRDPFEHTLDATISGEAIGGKKLVATRISSPQEASQCRILFISSSEESRLKSILAALNKLPVLTVSDILNFTDRGGMIQFVLDNGRVRFEVNLTSAEQAGLTLSSQLLKVASAVKRGGGRD
jgi:hypothetical protein